MAEIVYWRIYRQRFNETSEYEDIVIELLPHLIKRRKHGITVYDDDSTLHNEVELRWQTSRDNPTDAYGFRVELEAESLAYLQRGTALVRRVLRDLSHSSPTQVVQRLAALRPPAEMLIFDPRLGGYLQPARVPPPEIHRFVDDAAKVPGHYGRGCTVDALAHVEDGAVDKIEENMREWLANNKWATRGGRAGYLEAWLAAGRPVKDTTDWCGAWKAPTVKTARAIIAGE